MPLDNPVPQTEDEIIAALTPEQVKLLAYWRDVATRVVEHFSTLRRQHGLSDVELYIPEQRDIRETEKTLAYEFAASLVDSLCLIPAPGWRDSNTVIEESEPETQALVSRAVEYLAFRSLLNRNPDFPEWVQVRPESEPAHG